VATRPQTDPSVVDLYFDFYQQSASYTLNLTFANGSTQTIQTSPTSTFNFSLGNGGDKSVVAGSSVTNSIAATLVSGTTQAVSFTVSDCLLVQQGLFPLLLAIQRARRY